MNESERRLAALTFAALVFGLSFAGGFYTQASLSDQESFGGAIGAAANFDAGNDDGGTAGNDDGGTAGNDDGGTAGNDDGTVDTYDTQTAGNDGGTTDTDSTETSTSDGDSTDTSGNDSGDSCTGNTGNTDCENSTSFVSPGSGAAAPTADRRPLPASR